ncbi:MAG UNVERIFIED_CONTAM: hypothetical protein LVQ98_06065 [Rickettsiaceae bacterium]|jgi:DNA-binding IscR family transcriptional regulator
MKINNFVMILTTKGRYAVTAALYIAKNGSDQAINLSEDFAYAKYFSKLFGSKYSVS